jgi:hypothetical protein
LSHARPFTIAFLLGSLGAGAGETVSDANACPAPCENAVAYNLDPSFNADEQQLIAEGARVWEAGTGGRVCFVEGGDDLTFIRLERQSDLEPYDPDWPRHVALNKGNRIWIVAAEVDDPGEYRALVIHEIGHYLGLGHIEDTAATYMHGTINDTPRSMWKHASLPERDRRAYCTAHKCVCGG